MNDSILNYFRFVFNKKFIGENRIEKEEDNL